MVESIDNAIQIAVLVACTAFAVNRALKYDSRSWTLLALFFGNFAIDDLYLVLCIQTVGSSAALEVVSELSWYAAYIFLYLLIRQVAPPLTRKEKRVLPWLGPVFSLGMAAFFMQWGSYVSNLIYGVLIGLVLFTVIRRILDRAHYRKQLFLIICTLVFCLLEYALWIMSCYFKEDAITNPYYMIDFLITAGFPLFIFATRKAVVE